MRTSVFKLRKNAHGAKLFFDESGGVDIQRYDVVKYPIVAKHCETQESFFWRPTEINMAKDRLDFKEFDVPEEHIFTSNLKRQIVLDSIQGRGPALTYAAVASDPNEEYFCFLWNYFENIHSKSYTHIISSVYPNPSKIYDEMREIRAIVDMSKSIAFYYDDLLHKLKTLPYGHIEQKRAFWKSMVATNALEMLRFQISFPCTFSFGQRNKMPGACNINGLINKDEAVHGAHTNILLTKLLPLDDEDFARIKEEELDECAQIYLTVKKEEHEWNDYLHHKGSILGISKEELDSRINWVAGNQMNKLGLPNDIIIPKSQPLPWMNRWAKSEATQNAQQETENIEYQIGSVDMNFNSDDIDIDF